MRHCPYDINDISVSQYMQQIINKYDLGYILNYKYFWYMRKISEL